MVAGNPLVVRGRDLIPEREHGAATGRIPRAPGPGPVLRWRRVIHRRRAPRGCDETLAATDLPGDVEGAAVQLGDGCTGQVLQKTLEIVSPFNRAGGVAPEQFDDLLHRRTGADSLGSLTHLRLETMQLFPTPRIGLVQVDVAAEKLSCGEAVAVAPDGVSVRCCRRIHVAQESRQPGVRLGGLAGAGVDLGAQPTLVRAAAGESEEIGHAVAGLPAPHVRLPGADQGLAACRREPEIEAMAQGCL